MISDNEDLMESAAKFALDNGDVAMKLFNNHADLLLDVVQGDASINDAAKQVMMETALNDPNQALSLLTDNLGTFTAYLGS